MKLKGGSVSVLPKIRRTPIEQDMRGDLGLTNSRLSLSNNHIFHIPFRFSECSHLRYLNIRANNFREFPKGVRRLPFDD